MLLDVYLDKNKNANIVVCGLLFWKKLYVSFIEDSVLIKKSFILFWKNCFFKNGFHGIKMIYNWIFFLQKDCGQLQVMRPFYFNLIRKIKILINPLNISLTLQCVFCFSSWKGSSRASDQLEL